MAVALFRQFFAAINNLRAPRGPSFGASTPDQDPKKRDITSLQPPATKNTTSSPGEPTAWGKPWPVVLQVEDGTWRNTTKTSAEPAGWGKPGHLVLQLEDGTWRAPGAVRVDIKSLPIREHLPEPFNAEGVANPSTDDSSSDAESQSGSDQGPNLSPISTPDSSPRIGSPSFRWANQTAFKTQLAPVDTAQKTGNLATPGSKPTAKEPILPKVDSSSSTPQGLGLVIETQRAAPSQQANPSQQRTPSQQKIAPANLVVEGADKAAKKCKNKEPAKPSLSLPTSNTAAPKKEAAPPKPTESLSSNLKASEKSQGQVSPSTSPSKKKPQKQTPAPKEPAKKQPPPPVQNPSPKKQAPKAQSPPPSPQKKQQQPPPKQPPAQTKAPKSQTPPPKPEAKKAPQFQGNVVLETTEKAYVHARLANDPPPNRNSKAATDFGPHHLVLWTDASWTNHTTTSSRPAGISVVFPRSEQDRQRKGVGAYPDLWQDCAYTISNSLRGRESYCEMLAIEAALAIAADEVSERNSNTSSKSPHATTAANKPQKITRVTIFSDAKSELQAIHNTKTGGSSSGCFARGIAHSQKLKSLGVTTELRWVPGHVDVEGNERADRVAKLARCFGPDPGEIGAAARAEPVVMRVSVPLLEAFEGMLKTVGNLDGGDGRVKELVGLLERDVSCGLGRVVRQEGWVIDCNEGDGFPGW